MKHPILIAAAVAACTCNPCIEWTRLSGTVKSKNLRESTLTIQNKDGDFLVVPIDYQVQVAVGKKRPVVKEPKDIRLDDIVTLIRTPADKPKDDTEGLVPPRYPLP